MHMTDIGDVELPQLHFIIMVFNQLLRPTQLDAPYNTIQYKTCNAPYVTRMLFVGAKIGAVSIGNNSIKERVLHSSKLC